MLKYIFIFLSLLTQSLVNANNEKQLRTQLLQNYNKETRPVINLNNSVNMKIGIQIRNIEYFDQVSETIGLNMWITQQWYDQYLTWNTSQYDINYINMNSDEIWLPDLELYNAASKPKVYNMNNNIILYYDGKIEWTIPAIFSFLCPLSLQKFPYDSQICNMEYGSWKFSKDSLDIRPFDNSDSHSSFSISPDFSHNEWIINKISVQHNEYEYKCCPGEFWPVSTFSLNLERNPHKYNIILIMNIILTITAIIISLIKFRTYKRTYILVFIPLTIIWLIQSISSKIPVVNYFTKMDKILFSSFVICETLAIFSGFLYCLYQEYYDYLKKIFSNKKRFNLYKNIINNTLLKTISYDTKILNNYAKNKKIYIYQYIKNLDKIIKLCLIILYIILLNVFFEKN